MADWITQTPYTCDDNDNKVSVTGGAATVRARGGNDTVVVASGANGTRVYAGNNSTDGNDTVVLLADNSRVGASGWGTYDWGNDTLISGGNNNTLIDVNGNNVFQVYASGAEETNVTIEANNTSTVQIFADSITAGDNGATVSGTVSGAATVKVFVSGGANVVGADGNTLPGESGLYTVTIGGGAPPVDPVNPNNNTSDNVPVTGTDEADTINNSGTNVTINGGAGDDNITNTGANVTFIYNEGDGNDVINGFNESSTLTISGTNKGTTATVASDLVVTVGENTIILTGAATLTNPNIVNPTDPPVNLSIYQNKNDAYTGTPGDDTLNVYAGNNTYGSDTLKKTEVTLTGNGGSDSYTISTNFFDGTNVAQSNESTVNVNITDFDAANDKLAFDNVDSKALIVNYPTGKVTLSDATKRVNVTLDGATQEGVQEQTISFNGIAVKLKDFVFGSLTADSSNTYTYAPKTGTVGTETVITEASGNKIISAYDDAKEKIVVGTLPSGLNFIGDDFHFYTKEEVVSGDNKDTIESELIVENVMGKVIDIRDGKDVEFAKAYAATTASAINEGNTLGGGVKYIVGASSGNNTIYAGDNDSRLWGNTGNGSDILVGGAGFDIFFVGKNDGNDIIMNASSTDDIHLYDVSLSDITGQQWNNGTLALLLNTSNTVIIQTTDATNSPKFFFTDGEYRYNSAPGYGESNWKSESPTNA